MVKHDSVLDVVYAEKHWQKKPPVNASTKPPERPFVLTQ
jgi:hypothetical protein